MAEYDYIIIGAGSSGCVVANRLSANPSLNILLLESGPADRYPMIHMPGGMLEIFKNGNYHWQNKTLPQQHLNNRPLTLYTGKTLGGSSSLNGMLYIRGSSRDYDRWAEEEGCDGWSYQDVLPYFKETENSSRGENEHRGVQGELVASDSPERYAIHELVSAFEQSAIEAGIPKQADFCGGDGEGVGWTQATIKNGRRHSVATAFLKPILKRPNLTILTGAHVQQIDIVDGAAVGVTYLSRGQRTTLKARREVIVSAGALRTPALLQLSGIGAKAHLGGLGISLQADNPAVGENLHDHPTLKIQYRCKKPITLSGMSLFQQIKIGLQWLLTKKGIGSWNHFDGNIFTRSSPSLDEPDLQIQLIPLIAHGIEEGVGEEHGFTFVLCLLSEKSRGSVKLKSKDASVEPDYDLNFMDAKEDFAPLRAGIRLCRQLVGSTAWSELVGEELLPGSSVDSDDALDEFIRQTLETDYHYGGTCRMGDIDSPDTVVDSQLRVKGVNNLRVADASVMPLPLHGNTNSPCVMIGARLADMLLKGVGE